MCHSWDHAGQFNVLYPHRDGGACGMDIPMQRRGTDRFGFHCVWSIPHRILSSCRTCNGDDACHLCVSSQSCAVAVVHDHHQLADVCGVYLVWNILPRLANSHQILDRAGEGSRSETYQDQSIWYRNQSLEAASVSYLIHLRENDADSLPSVDLLRH
jgi:hypothetical protein